MDFVQNEHNILKFWKEKKIFEKLRKKIKGKKPWSFLDGPITANNPMGVHHAWGRTYKDLFQRYYAMKGFDQRFQNGFDCQGLWVEVEVEKELGFKNKKDIEAYGIDKFVEKCQERVKKYSKIQTEQSIRLGQWMDWENSYFTMSDENNYAIWHFLKKCYQKNFLYKGHDVVPWCPRCGTAISQHEILTEEYKEILHKSIYVKFQVKNQKSKIKITSQNSKLYFLVWTTTPWTLPGNVALAVHPDLIYAKIKDKDNNLFILLKEKAGLVENGEIIEELKGKELEGAEYEGIFDELSAVQKNLGDYQHKVILWKEITVEEGTGIVHIAPGCGEEDFQLSQEYNLPVVNPTDEESKYEQGFGELTGNFVGSQKIRDWIFKNLEEKNRVFKIEDYLHRYPTCWRCKQELIFRLVDEWYIAMGKPSKSKIKNQKSKSLRDDLIKAAKKIRWIPSFGLDRELDWLNNMKDWLISKKRYWGLALPIWQCDCGNFEVVGSPEELKEKAEEGWQDFKGHSPHRPWVDKIKIKCSKCGELISRIPDVGNPWLDAGIVPYSTMGYFSDRKFWKKWFPADFITESFPGQFKNWFYSILVMSQVLENKPPFKTLFGYASVVDEKGEEMHKSKGNAIWFDEAVEKIGADVMRWMYLKANPFDNLRFGYKAAEETKRKLLVLYNCYSFFNTYRSAADVAPAFGSMSQKPFIPIVPLTAADVAPAFSGKSPDSHFLLDKWIVSRLNNLIEEITEFLDNTDPSRAALAIEDFFIQDLSLWHIRRSRKRFQNPERPEEKIEAEKTLYFVLLEITKLLAPIMPFFAEKIYQELRTEKMPESVHLCDWPEAEKKAVDKKLEEEMALVRDIVAKVLAKRTELGIKVRQPLRKLKVKSQKLKVNDNENLIDLIKDEVNVKEIVFDETIKDEIELDAELTPELKEEGLVREIVRQIQDLRKKAGLTPRDRIAVYYSDNPELENIVLKNKSMILKETRSNEIKAGFLEGAFFEKKINFNNQEIIFKIKKVG